MNSSHDGHTTVAPIQTQARDDHTSAKQNFESHDSSGIISTHEGYKDDTPGAVMICEESNVTSNMNSQCEGNNAFYTVTFVSSLIS